MEEITMDETETVCKRTTKPRRSSILKQRTPLQVIEPNPRRVSFAFKQTKEFHSTEAPFVLGSSYEETFQSDSPECSQESHFTMKMIHSTTTTETYSDRSNEGNTLTWHEEVFNTTHVVNVDNFGSSESEYEARMSIDIQETEAQHCTLGAEKITQKFWQENAYHNEQMENAENLTPEVLDHFMKRQKIQASKQIQHYSVNSSLYDQEREETVNISEFDISNPKANILHHHSSQRFIEPSFPRSHIRNEKMWNNELMPYILNRTESKKFSRSLSPVNGNKCTEVVQLGSDAVCISKDKFLMDTDMDFTDVISTNKTGSGSDTFHVNDNMDLTKGTFCRRTINSIEGAQKCADLDESDIEITSTIGHIAVPESADVFTKISGINVLECDTGSISDSTNTQNSNDSQLEFTNTVRQNIDAEGTNTSINRLEFTNIAKQTSPAKDTEVNQLEITDIINQEVPIKHPSQFTNLAMPNTFTKDVDDIEMEFTKSTMQKSLSVDSVSLVYRHEGAFNTRQLGNINNFGNFESEYEARMTLDVQETEAQRCSSSAEEGIHKYEQGNACQNEKMEDTEDLTPEVLDHIRERKSHSLEQMKQSGSNNVCDQQRKKPVNTFKCDTSNTKANVLQHHASQKLIAPSFPSSHVIKNEEIRKNELYMPYRNESEEFSISACPLNGDQFTEVTQPGRGIVCVNQNKFLMDADMDFTNVLGTNKASSGCDTCPASNNMDMTKGASCKGTNNNNEGAQNYADLDESEIEITNTVGHIAVPESEDMFTKSSRINVITGSISDLSDAQNLNDNHLEMITNTKHKLLAKHSDDSGLEFTNIAGQNVAAEITNVNVSQLEFTNITKQKSPTQNAKVKQLEITDAVNEEVLAKHSDGSELKWANPPVSEVPMKDDVSQVEFAKSTMQESLGKGFVDSELEFTNIVKHKVAVEHVDVSLPALTNITGQKLLEENTVTSQLDITNTKPQEQPAKDCDNSNLEFISSTKQQLSLKDTFSETQHYGLGTETVTRKYEQGNAYQNEQMENAENLTPKMLDCIKEQKIQGSEQMRHHSGINLFVQEREKPVNISLCNTSSTKANSLQHHSLQILSESSFSSSHITGNEVCKNEFMPYRSDSKEFSSGSPLNGDEITEATQPSRGTVFISKSKFLMDTDMDFTNVIGTNKASSGCDTYPVNNNVDMTKGASCKGTNDTEGAQEYADLNESEIEITNTVGHISVVESEDMYTKISGINVLECDSGSISDSSSAQNLDDNHLELISNTQYKLLAKHSGSELEFTNTVRQDGAAEVTNVSQLEFTNVTKQNSPTKNTKADQLEITDINQKLPAKHFDGSELEFTNLAVRKFPAGEVDVSQVEFVRSTLQKSPAKDFVDSELEFANTVKHKVAAENVDSLLTLTNIAGQKLIEKNITSQLDITDTKTQELPAVDSDNSHMGFINSTRQQLYLKYPVDSELQFTNSTSNRLFAEGCDSQLQFSSMTQKLPVEDPNNIQLEFTNSIRQKQSIEGSGDSQIEFSNLTRQKLSAADSGNTQLQFTNITTDRLAERYSSHLELTSVQGLQTSAKGSNESQLEFTSTAGCISPLNNSADVELEVTATTELRKVSPRHIDVIPQSASDSQTDITSTASCEAIKNVPECASIASGIPTRNLSKYGYSDNMEFTNKQNCESQASDSLEFTNDIKYVNHVSKDSLLQEKSHLLSHLCLETSNLEQLKDISIGSNVQQSSAFVSPHQDEFAQVIAIADLKVTPEKGKMVRDSPRRVLSSKRKGEHVQKKVQKAAAFLDITMGSDEAHIFESYTAYSVPSPPKRIHLGADSENMALKENHKQSIEHTQNNLLCEVEHTSLTEDELVTPDICSSNLDSEDNSCDSLTKSILDADRNLFGSTSTASPATELSSASESSAAVNAKEHLAEELHLDLKKPKEMLHSSEPETITDLERNFTDGYIHKTHVSKQPSDRSRIKTQMCHTSSHTNLLPVTSEDVSAVKQADSSYGEDTSMKVVDSEASGREKETQLQDITLAHSEFNCRESIEKVIIKDKMEELEAAVASDGRSSTAVVQKPLSLEEWLRRKHEWDVKELSDDQWSFLFLYKSLGLILKLDAANLKDGMKHIDDILLESYLTKKSPPEAHFVHFVLLKKLSPQNLKTKFKVTLDVPELMSIVSKEVAEMKLFMRNFIFMETCTLMEMKDNRVSFKMSDMHIHAVFRVTVDLSNWEDIKPENVTVDNLMGTVNKEEVQNLVNAVAKGPEFLSEYVSVVREYISVLRKKYS